MKEKIIENAYSIFREWIQTVIIEYPDLNVQIKEIEILKKDFYDSLKKAKLSLLKEERKEARKFFGYDYEYITGYVEANLNVYWFHEYITKQTLYYKELIALSVLESYFKYDELLTIKLDGLYLEKYKSEVNIEKLESKIALDLPNEVDFLETANNNQNILLLLENIKIKMVKENFIMESPEFTMNIKNYISYLDVKFILESYDF